MLNYDRNKLGQRYSGLLIIIYKSHHENRCQDRHKTRDLRNESEVTITRRTRGVSFLKILTLPYLY